MEPIAKFRVGEVTLTRVPYFDVALDADAVALTNEELAAIEWAQPAWATSDGRVLVGVVVWIVESDGRQIVVDPCGAADPFVRTPPEAIGHQEAVLAAVREAGFDPERIDTVLLTHLDGIGLAAIVDADGAWTPAFPNARIVMTNAELDALANGGAARGLEVLQSLIAQGVVDGVEGDFALTDSVRFELTRGHSPGHAVVQIESEGERAVMIGHLAISPVGLAYGEPDRLHADGPRSAAVIDTLVADAAAARVLLIGPLWPFPGAGYVDEARVVVPAV